MVYRVWLVIITVAVLQQSAVAQDSENRPSQRGIFGAGQPGEVAVVRREAKKMGIKNFQMQSRSANGRLAIDAFSGNLGSGVISGTGLVDWSQQNGPQRMRIEFSGVEANVLMKAFEMNLDAQIGSMVSGVLDVQWQGVRGSLPRQTMQGNVQMQLGPGSISGTYALQKAAAVTGIAELQRFDFSHGQVTGVIRDGIMSIQTLNIVGPTQQALGNGALDLRTEDVRVKFELSVAPALAERSTKPQVRAASSMVSKARKGSSANLVKLPIPAAMVGKIRDPDFVFELASTPAQTERKAQKPPSPGVGQ